LRAAWCLTWGRSGRCPKLRVLRLFGTGIRSWPRLSEFPYLEELDVMCTSLSNFHGVEDGRGLRAPESTREHPPSTRTRRISNLQRRKASNITIL
jgi:hypothetical protein